MLIVNEQFHFSFEIPDEYEEIPQSDYLMYHIDKASTLHIFIKYDTIPHTISINRDDFVEDEKDYEALGHRMGILGCSTAGMKMSLGC